MSDQIITMTQDELDTLIETRIARVRREYVESGQHPYKAHSRKWEERCKAVQGSIKELEADRDAWKARAKFNIAQIQVLEKLNTKILDRLERHAA